MHFAFFFAFSTYLFGFFQCFCGKAHYLHSAGNDSLCGSCTYTCRPSCTHMRYLPAFAKIFN